MSRRGLVIYLYLSDHLGGLFRCLGTFFIFYRYSLPLSVLQLNEYEELAVSHNI